MRTPKTCLELDALAFPVKLMQQGRDRFTILYGLMSKTDLDYEEAGRELGLCIMHALSCEGKLDNR